MQDIKVLLVDDDAVCCDGLRQLLSLASDIKVVGVAASAAEAFELGRTVRPDVVIIDAELPRAECVEAMRKLRGGPADPKNSPSFICLAVYPDQHDAAIQAGAARFLRKDGSPRELLSAIREAAGRPRHSPPPPLPPNPARPAAEQGF